MKKIKMARGVTLTFEEGCNKYLENCRQRNLREGTINHYRQSYLYFYKYFDQRLEILSELIPIIHEQDIQAAYQYIITALDITDHTLEQLVADLKEHLEYYS